MRFSERIGKKTIRETLQVDSIGQSIQNKLWNLIVITVFEKLKSLYLSDAKAICNHIWKEFFNGPEDETSYSYAKYRVDFAQQFQEKIL
jgi:hypothetical protein